MLYLEMNSQKDYCLVAMLEKGGSVKGYILYDMYNVHSSGQGP